MQADGLAVKADGTSNRERPVSTPLDLSGQFVIMGAESVVVVDTGAAAKWVCFWRLEHRNTILGSRGTSRVATCPACARFRLGDGRPGEVRRAADAPAGIAGSRWGDISASAGIAGSRRELRVVGSSPLLRREAIFRVFCAKGPQGGWLGIRNSFVIV